MAHVPFGVEERDVTREPYGSLERHREHVFYASEWVDYSDGEKGLTLIGALGVQGFHFDPERRILSHTLLKAIRRPQEGWERFETRRREARGTQVFHYALIPHAGDWRRGDITRLSVAFHRPLQAMPRTHWSRNGDLPESRSFLTITPDHVLLSAWYEDQGNILLRIYESSGHTADVTVTVPFSVGSVVETDLSGEPRANSTPIQIRGNRFSCTIGAWEILTLGVEESLGQKAP
jgi:alpha-mannosidase